MRVVISGRTRYGNNICIGGHEEESFESLRLFNSDGGYLPSEHEIAVGDIWDLDYRPAPNITPPHVEDVIVSDWKKAGRIDNMGQWLMARATGWQGPPDRAFDRLPQATSGGSLVIPSSGPLPDRSTGYWRPTADLVRADFGDSVRFSYATGSVRRSIKWVGTDDPPNHIPDRSLVRLSLSGEYQPSPDLPNGYWLQISGFFPVE